MNSHFMIPTNICCSAVFITSAEHTVINQHSEFTRLCTLVVPFSMESDARAYSRVCNTVIGFSIQLFVLEYRKQSDQWTLEYIW